MEENDYVENQPGLLFLGHKSSLSEANAWGMNLTSIV